MVNLTTGQRTGAVTTNYMNEVLNTAAMVAYVKRLPRKTLVVVWKVITRTLIFAAREILRKTQMETKRAVVKWLMTR